MNKDDPSRNFPVDSNLPRWQCQNCRHNLTFAGVDSYADKYFSDASPRSGMQGSSVNGTGSVLGSIHMDHSFVVLPKPKKHAQGVPPRSRGGPFHLDTNQTTKAMEESYVVLSSPAASVYKSESASDGNGPQLPSPERRASSPLQPTNSGFHSTVTVLKRAFDVATTQTKVEQPLCLECMRVLSAKLDKEVEDVKRDIEAYEACLQRLEGETKDVLTEADFLKEKLKIEEEERKLEAAIEETEKKCAEVNAELKDLELKSSRFNELEERYWHEFNDFQFQFTAHQEERDAILTKIEVSQAHLELLKKTNVLSDAFPIWHDGDFVTINNFRLGRLPKVPVEWDEINAAWGQACLLLHTMAQYFRPKYIELVTECKALQSMVLVVCWVQHVWIIHLLCCQSKKKRAQGVPPRPRDGPFHLDTNQTTKAMEESYVVLPPPAASVYKSEPASDGNGPQLPSPERRPSSPLQPTNSGFHSTVTVLKRAFDVATTQTKVEQPLCLECMRVLSAKLDKEVEDVNRDIEAYEACLQRLEGETKDVLTEADFLKEKLKIEEEERKLDAAIDETEKKCAEVNTELKDLELKSSRFNELEERYWHEFNDFQFQFTAHQEERDAILTKIEVSQAHLELLKKTNVLSDAFPIWHDGDFGTINNFRLGRLPKVPVEWDEINAAWGQACLLLHTMAQYFRPKFAYRIKIVPMGSYPRITDTSNNNTYELFGPVNLFWSTRYDKAMILYLSCLKDFAEFAYLKDQENNIPAEKCFKLPKKIDGDKVENFSITQSFNKQENWTKALKYTLCNLKWALYWFVGNTNFQPLYAMVPSHPAVPPGGSMFIKSGPGSKIASKNLSKP